MFVACCDVSCLEDTYIIVIMLGFYLHTCDMLLPTYLLCALSVAWDYPMGVVLFLVQMRRLTQIKELQGKITKAKRLVDMDEPSLDNEDYLEGPVEKPR